MFDHVKLRGLADRAATLQADAKAAHDELYAMLPPAVSEEDQAVIAQWPKEDRDCRLSMLHAVFNLSKAIDCLGIAVGDLGDATIGVQI